MASKKEKKAEERAAKPAKSAKAPKAEKSKGLLPKTINGAKLPKEVREKLTDLAKHPVVADLLAAGLVALAARLKNEPKVKEGASKAVSKALDAGAGTGQDMAHLAADIATAVVAPVVKRIRTAAVAAAAAPAEDQEAESPPTPTAPAPLARTAAAAAATSPPARRRRTVDAGAGPSKPRATRRAAPTPADAAPGSQENDDA